MNRALILLAVVCCISLSVDAQDNVLRGKIVNKETGEPIAFANVVLPGTTHGTSSDIDGNFSIGITSLMDQVSFKISAVGFTPYMLSVASANKSGVNEVLLEPMVYAINDVDVYGKSLVYRKLLKQAVENIGNNYIQTPYNYVGYFIEKTNNGDIEHYREAQVTIYNAAGYKRSNPLTVFKNEGYNFNEVRRSFDVVSAYDAQSLMDDVLAADVVLNMRNVLDVDNIDDFSLSNKGDIKVDGRDVQVISFVLEKPTLANNSIAGAKSCSGEIYIDKQNFAVLQYNISMTLSGKNYLGMDFMPNDNRPMTLDMQVSYKPLNSKYVLSGVSFRCAEKSVQFITTDVVTNSPEVIKERVYFENGESYAPFWESYSVKGI